MEELIKHLRYEPETGHLFWIDGQRKGLQAGCKNKDTGYIAVRHKGKSYRAHRVIWLMVHGDLPDAPLDHINRVRDDNRIVNLRLSNNASNSANRGGRGYMKRRKPNHSHQVYVQVDGKKRYIGSEFCPLMAHIMYLDARFELHGV